MTDAARTPCSHLWKDGWCSACGLGYAAWATETIAALTAEVERLRNLANKDALGWCEVCWSISWTPIESETECTLVHPHRRPEQHHVRCETCWLRAQQ